MSSITKSHTSLLEENISLLNSFVKQSNSSQARPMLEGILAMIVANGALWKAFKRWGKENGIAKEALDRGNISRIADAFQHRCLNTDTISTLRDSILEAERINKGFGFQRDYFPLLAPEAMEKPLHAFNSEFLREGLRKGYKAVQRALSVIEAYEKNVSLIKGIRELNNGKIISKFGFYSILLGDLRSLY